MIPETQGAGPHEVTSNLIDAVHRAIQTHPAVDAKADFGKILATLLQRQAKQHAAHTTATSHAVMPATAGLPDEGLGAQYVPSSRTDNLPGVYQAFSDNPQPPQVVHPQEGAGYATPVNPFAAALGHAPAGVPNFDPMVAAMIAQHLRGAM